MSKLTGEVAVVTGASKGIGAAIANSLAAEGVLSRELGPKKIRVNTLSPGDIASIAIFLASEDSAWLTGERLLASGGLR
jgi:3-oxoacyl-[acyl-carrier protein] reductase